MTTSTTALLALLLVLCTCAEGEHMPGGRPPAPPPPSASGHLCPRRRRRNESSSNASQLRPSAAGCLAPARGVSATFTCVLEAPTVSSPTCIPLPTQGGSCSRAPDPCQLLPGAGQSRRPHLTILQRRAHWGAHQFKGSWLPAGRPTVCWHHQPLPPCAASFTSLGALMCAAALPPLCCHRLDAWKEWDGCGGSLIAPRLVLTAA